MAIHRPARSTLALLTASVVLPLGAAHAAAPDTSTTASATATTTVAQPTSETTTTLSTSTQTATSFSTSSSSTTSRPTTTTTTSTTRTTSADGHAQWSEPSRPHRHGQDLVIGVTHRAHAASDPTDTISDFKFSPATITVHVGDTITWVNDGPAPHTATANNGSFDTGNLNKGQSASHTFTQAGTFAYICKIHPFMHGTVVVLAASSSSQSGSGSTGATSSGSTTAGSTGAAASGTTPSASAAVTATGSGLPNTGMNLLAGALAGAALLGGGFALRRVARRSPRRAA